MERKHHHIVETGLSTLFNGHVPSSYWVHTFHSAVYIINHLPTRVLQNKSPFEALFSQAPSYDHFRLFGCRVYPYLRDYVDHKLSPRSLPCIFLGYFVQYKGYLCLEPVSSRIYVTRHAKFDEFSFPFCGSSSPASLNGLLLVTFQDDTPCSQPSSSITSSPSTTNFNNCGLCDENPQHVGCLDDLNQSSSTPTDHVSSSPLPEATQTPPTPSTHSPAPSAQSPIESIQINTSTSPAPAFSLPHTTTQPPAPVVPPIASTHPMVTRAKAKVFKPKYRADLSYTALHSTLFAASDPTTYESVASESYWVDAMNAEILPFILTNLDLGA